MDKLNPNSPDFAKNHGGKLGQPIRRVAAMIVGTLGLMASPVIAQEAKKVDDGVNLTVQAIGKEDILKIIAEGKDKIRTKYPSFTEQAYLQTIAKIVEGNIDMNTLKSISLCFETGSKEYTSLAAYAQSLAAQNGHPPVSPKVLINSNADKKNTISDPTLLPSTQTQIEELENAGWTFTEVKKWNDQVDRKKVSKKVLDVKNGTVYIDGKTSTIFTYNLSATNSKHPIMCVVEIQNVSDVLFGKPNDALIMRPGEKIFPALKPRFGDMVVEDTGEIILAGELSVPDGKSSEIKMILDGRGFEGKDDKPAKIRVFFGTNKSAQAQDSTKTGPKVTTSK